MRHTGVREMELVEEETGPHLGHTIMVFSFYYNATPFTHPWVQYDVGLATRLLVLATAYWVTSAQGGVTRRGVVLTYLLSLVIGSQ